MKVWRGVRGTMGGSFQTFLGFLFRFWAKPKMKGIEIEYSSNLKYDNSSAFG